MRHFLVSWCVLFLVSSSAWAWTSEQEAKLQPSDFSYGDCFGRSIALEGDTALVGAEGSGSRSGAAHVFTRTGGVWTEQALLLPGDGQVDDIFGMSVALFGDSALIGAPGDDEAAGSVYVFTRADGVWTEQAKLMPADGAPGDGFGVSVALHDKTAVIGAYGNDGNGIDSGAAYVFRRTGGVWSERAKLMPADGSADDCFGRSVALDRGTAVVGAIRDGDNGLWAGSAYVFDRLEGEWIESAKLLAGDGEALDYFGFSVAVDRDIAAIGATGDDQSAGSVYVFVRTYAEDPDEDQNDDPNEDSDEDQDEDQDEDLGVWNQEAKLVPDDACSWDWFGSAVALAGEMIVVGRPGDAGAGINVGSAYVFSRELGGWTQQMKLLPAFGAPYDYFGTAVALDGQTAAIATPYDDNSSAVDSGSAFVFKLVPPETTSSGVSGEHRAGAGGLRALDDR